MGILGLIRKEDFEHAEKQIETLYGDFLKEDSGFFSKIPVENLTRKLLEEHNYTNGHLEILAWLFDTQAELERSRGNNKLFLEYSKKALLLFEFTDNEQKTYSSERIGKIEEIKKRIRQ